MNEGQFNKAYKAEQERLEALKPEELFGEVRWDDIRDNHIEYLNAKWAEELAASEDEELFGSDLDGMLEREILNQLGSWSANYKETEEPAII